MPDQPISATTLVLSFIDRINRGDLDGLLAMMSDDHRLEVFGEPPVVGRAANAAAWRGYLEAFPRYEIHPRRASANGGLVAILGHTTGSHLGLPDEQERRRTLIWIAQVRARWVARWRLIEDSPDNRKRLGLDH